MGRVDDNVAPVHPDNIAVIDAPIPLAARYKFFVIQRIAELVAILCRMLHSHLMHEVTLRRWHIHRDQEFHLSLLTTLPSIFFFHSELRPPGRGFLDFFAPI